MRRSFLKIALDQCGVTQAALARKLGWTEQRVCYLAGPQCKGFPLDKLWQLKQALGLSDADLLSVLTQYFGQINTTTEAAQRGKN